MKGKVLLSSVLIIAVCAFMPLTEVQAAQASAAEAEQQVPDVTGMSLADAESVLADVTLSGGGQIEIIKEYQYSDTAPADEVLQQSIEASVSSSDTTKVNLVVSLGQEPLEELPFESIEVSETGSFGLSAYNSEPVIVIDGSYDDWQDKPCSWEYNWDNSDNCWKWGVWGNGLEGYTTPEGTYDANVRHQVSLFVDGEYVYLYIKFARIYDPGFNGWDNNFSLGGDQSAKFVLTDLDGSDFDAANKDAGLYELVVKHGDASMSWGAVEGAKAFLRIYDYKYNAELEMKIPLSQMKAQNPNMDVEHIGMISWWNPNLTYRAVYASGAGTMPFALAGIALIGVPLSTAYIKKKNIGNKKKGACE